MQIKFNKYFLHLEIIFKVQLIQNSILFSVWFKQVSLYIQHFSEIFHPGESNSFFPSI